MDDLPNDYYEPRIAKTPVPMRPADVPGVEIKHTPAGGAANPAFHSSGRAEHE
jgi:hypothetical protein